MKHSHNRNEKKQTAVSDSDEKKLLNKLALKIQTGKISTTLSHKHSFHHGPLLNTRRPHVPHG